MDENVSESFQNDLTSTVDVPVESSEEKQAASAVNATTSDSIPSSSSDANTGIIMTDCGQDDPISSTSDTIDVFYKSNLNTGATKTSMDAEEDLFANDLNISDVPTEKITEDVEDIVNDLENLLGESSDFSLTKSTKLETTELVDESFQELLNNFEAVEKTEQKIFQEKKITTPTNVKMGVLPANLHSAEIISTGVEEIKNKTNISETESNEQQIPDNLETNINANNCNPIEPEQILFKVVHNIPDLVESSLQLKEDQNIFHSNETVPITEVGACVIDKLTSKVIEDKNENVCDKTISKVAKEKLKNCLTKEIPSGTNDLHANIVTEIKQFSGEIANLKTINDNICNEELLNSNDLPSEVLELNEDVMDDEKVTAEKMLLSDAVFKTSNKIESYINEPSPKLIDETVEFVDKVKAKKDEKEKIKNVPSCIEEKQMVMHEEAKQCLTSEVEVESGCVSNENIVELSNKLETIKETTTKLYDVVLDNIQETCIKKKEIINVDMTNLEKAGPEKNLLNSGKVNIETSDIDTTLIDVKEEKEDTTDQENISEHFVCTDIFVMKENKEKYVNKKLLETIELPNISNDAQNSKEVLASKDATIQIVNNSEITLNINCVKTADSQSAENDENNSLMQYAEKDECISPMGSIENVQSCSKLQCAEEGDGKSINQSIEEVESTSKIQFDEKIAHNSSVHSILDHSNKMQFMQTNENSSKLQCTEKDESNIAVQYAEKIDSTRQSVEEVPSNNNMLFAEKNLSKSTNQSIKEDPSNSNMQFAEEDAGNSTNQSVEGNESNYQIQHIETEGDSIRQFIEEVPSDSKLQYAEKGECSRTMHTIEEDAINSKMQYDEDEKNRTMQLIDEEDKSNNSQQCVEQEESCIITEYEEHKDCSVTIQSTEEEKNNSILQCTDKESKQTTATLGEESKTNINLYVESIQQIDEDIKMDNTQPDLKLEPDICEENNENYTEIVQTCNIASEEENKNLPNKESPEGAHECISEESSKSSADNQLEIIIENNLKDQKDIHVFESINENVHEHLDSSECSESNIETLESTENQEMKTEQVVVMRENDNESMQNDTTEQLKNISALNVEDDTIEESNTENLDNLESRIINEAVNSIIENPSDSAIFTEDSETLKEPFSVSENVLDSTKVDLCGDIEQAVKTILNPVSSNEVSDSNLHFTEDITDKENININASDVISEKNEPNNTVESSSENITQPEVLSKILTIEVDDIQSETYETSNDEPVDEVDESKPEYSSRISKVENLKMTITKQRPEESHSILKIYNPEDVKDCIPKIRIKTTQQDSMEVLPKLNLKAMKSSESQNSPKRVFRNSPKSSDSHSPKLRNNSPTSTKSNRKELLSPLKLTIKPVVRPDEIQSKSSPKITIKPITKPEDKIEEDKIIDSSKNSPKLKILLKSEDQQTSEATLHNPKITIKPITKTDEDVAIEQARSNPKITIKPIPKPEDDVMKTVKATNRSTKTEPESTRQNPKVTIKPVVKSDLDVPKTNPKVTIKPIIKPEEEIAKSKVNDHPMESSRHSPKITIKPIIKPEEEEDCSRSSPKIIIKPIVKPEDECEISHHSPKITIKPVLKTDDDIADTVWTNPKVIIKPIIKPDDEAHSPKIIIKPIPKPPETSELSPKISMKPIKDSENTEPPKITIKPIQKPHEHTEVVSPRITIKPILKPSEEESQPSSTKTRSKKSPEKLQTDDLTTLIDFEDQIKQERIVLKIQKNTIPTPTSSRKRDYTDDEEKSEKMGRIKLKFSKEGGHTKIISNKELKRSYQENLEDIELKRQKIEDDPLDDVIEIVPVFETKEKEPLKETENVVEAIFKDDPLDKIPVFEITPESAAAMKNTNLGSTNAPATAAPIAPAPRKRGRPRKVPLEVREEFKEESQPPPQPVVKESTRPKRSCRGPSVRTTLGIKPRKPRGPGRGRGGKRGTGRVGRPPGRSKLSDTKLKLLKDTVNKDGEDDFKDVEMRELDKGSNKVSSDVVMYEEETRMSAETSTSSRAQTPAKQIPTPIVPDVEESQSSVQSSATTESVKVRRSGLPRLEVHKEPEGAVISAEQLAEYYWGGGGPYMLQEQVAQFLGIKSFKRKYPGIKRRPVEMQERDFIREQSLASEAMCDLGLTAVNSSDILDIMYSDFQHKYEEYCKHQRDRQVKDLSNKQRALSLAASQEKNKYDILQQAVQSAATWNASFNKSRREERKACMDLQTFTVNYPKGRAKQIGKLKIGNYPLALVPGQFTDYYRTFTPNEINNLPLNTICFTPEIQEDSNSDSGTESDSSSSDSDSTTSDSSDDDCNLCTPPSTPKNVLAH